MLKLFTSNTSLLYAPDSYVTASPQVRAGVVNGCGPGGWKIDLVPDTVYGLDISPACNIHDWMYAAGSNTSDKEEADRVFLNNTLRLIDGATGFWAWFLRPVRRVRAREYYEAVHIFGGPAFWADKNPETHLVAAAAAGIR